MLDIGSSSYPAFAIFHQQRRVHRNKNQENAV
jgi:hypothetical protein